MSLKLQILMALLSCAAVKAQCPNEGLEDGQSMCTSCLTYITCDGEAPSDPTPCPAGTACVQDGDTNAVCVTPTTHECVTCPAGSLTACDPFNPNLVVACVAGQAPVQIEDCRDPDGEVCQNGVCVVGTTPDPGSGGNADEQCSDPDIDPDVPVIITSKPECTSGLLCSGGVALSIINCTEGQYFDPRTSKCQSLPVDNCDGYGDGKAPSRTDCTIFAVCQGGVEVADFDCDPGFVFDVVVNDCVDATTGNYTCGDLIGCTFGSDGPC